MCLWGAFHNAGQSRNSIKQILVDESISSDVTNMLSEKVFKLFHLSDPMDESCNYGCIRWSLDMGYLDNIVEDAQKDGGIVTIGGFKNTDDKGNGRFYEPTVIANAN